MSKIYTKTGDMGNTSLVGGGSVNKSDFLLDVYGTCDELNANIGALIAEEEMPFLTKIQENLFIMGGILATPKEKYEQYWKSVYWEEFLLEIENEIDEMSKSLPVLDKFLLPQGSRAIAQAHICRTMCRKLERKIAQLCKQDESLLKVLPVTNRLSDYFFILARFLHKKFNIEEKYLKLR